MPNPMQEMIEKTSIKVDGICKGVNEFVSQKGVSYWSVDVEVKGTRMPINIKLPANFKKESLRTYELCSLLVTIKPGFDRKGIELHAMAA